MKRVFCFLLGFICLLNIFTFSSFAQPIDDFSVCWKRMGGALQVRATYFKDGVSYEMVVNGLNSVIDKTILEKIVEHIDDGKSITLTDPGIIDAEKFSCINPMTDGILPFDRFVDMSGIREEQNWGDSLQCWASSAASMLTTTGWTKKAINPDSGKAFKDEDEVFSLFTKYCLNMGCYAYDGIEFFINGKISKRMDESNIVRYDFQGVLPDVDISNYLDTVTICDDDESDNEKEYKKGLEFLSHISDGGSIGLSLSISEPRYVLKEDPSVELNKYRDKYRSDEYIYINKSQPLDEVIKQENNYGFVLEKHFYAVNENDEVVILEKYGNKYREISGKFVDTALVKEDVLLKINDSTYLYPFSIDEESYCYINHKYYSKSEINTIKNPASFDYYGGHAVTANGYIKNISTDTIEGLFVVNSDNDSDFMPYLEENLSKENRPNRMVVYPVETVKGENNIALTLSDYDDNMATITKMVLLLPENGMPSYLIGDADMNSKVEISDATQIQRWLAKLVTNDKIDKLAADADMNSIVEIIDATCIQKFLSKISNIDGTFPYSPTYPYNY